jgi:glycosyltransferase involved in cell wall biosynthesis
MTKIGSKITGNKISAIIIAKDEEDKMVDCLKSISWCDEIILVDTGSTDKTVVLAKKAKARIYEYQGGSYSDWRNEGLKHTKGKWVFYIDADERVTDELRNEISKLISNFQRRSRRSFPISNNIPIAYAIPRRNVILGREMRHGGWWPDYVKRLFYKDKLKKWVGDLHEEPVFDGVMGHLEKALIHIKENKLSDMVEKTNKWSEIEARLMFDSNHPKMSLIRFLSAILREFWYRIIKKKAYLDGTEGMIFGIYQVYSRFISYAKLWEMQNINQKPKLI